MDEMITFRVTSQSLVASTGDATDHWSPRGHDLGRVHSVEDNTAVSRSCSRCSELLLVALSGCYLAGPPDSDHRTTSMDIRAAAKIVASNRAV